MVPHIRSVWPAALALMAGSTLALGQTDVRWLNPVNGQWNTAANWDLNVVPNNNGTDYRAILDVAGPNFEVELDGDITITALQILGSQSRLNLTANALTVEADWDIDQGFLFATPGSGSITIGGTATLNAAFIQSAAIQTDGILNFEGPAQTDLCDTGIDHRGSAVNWSGAGTIALSATSFFTNGASSTFTVSGTAPQSFLGTAGSVFTNNGILTKSTGTDTAFFDGGDFVNAGEVRIESGTLRTNGVDILAAGGVLQSGTWQIEDGAALELVDGGGLNHQILTNQATVIVNGPSASFDALNSIDTNGTSGQLTFAGGTQFTTAGDFTNNGTLTVGQTSIFRVMMGNSLTNVSGAALAGGTFEVLDGGSLQADNLTGLQSIDATVTLRGTTADIQNNLGQSVLPTLQSIGASGTLTLDTRDLEVVNNFTVASTGSLVVEAGTTFSVAAGSVLTNFVGGTLVDGSFTIRGEIIADNLDVQQIDNAVILDDADALFTNRTTGLDAFSNLNLLSGSGSLTVANGRDLTTVGSLSSTPGTTLTVGAAAGANTSVVTVNGDFNAGGTVQLGGGNLVVTGQLNLTGSVAGNGTINGQIVNNGAFDPGNSPGCAAVVGNFTQGTNGSMTMELAGLVQGVGYDCIQIDGGLIFEGGIAGTLHLRLIDNFVPADGDFFDILTFHTLSGLGFADITTSGVPTGGTLETLYLADRVRVVYHAVPTPSGVVAFLALARRRRREPR